MCCYNQTISIIVFVLIELTRLGCINSGDQDIAFLSLLLLIILAVVFSLFLLSLYERLRVAKTGYNYHSY